MTSKDADVENVLLDMEDGEEGDEVNIEENVDTEVEPVRMAADPGKPTDSTIWHEEGET